MTEHNPTVEIAVLGPLLVRVGGCEHPITAIKQRLLLARLVVSDGAVASQDQLIDALWGEAPPATAAKNLQVLVGRLRAIVGRDAIRTEPGGYRLDTVRCRVDVVVFECLVSEAERRRADAGNASEVIPMIADALAIWRGDVASELKEPWGLAVAARWREMRRIAHEQLLRLRVNYGPDSSVVTEIRAELEHEPHRESLWGLLVDAHRVRGDLSAARATLEEARALLAGELGLSPGADLSRRADELGVDVGSIPPPAPVISTNLLDAISAIGPRFRVTELLAAVQGQASDADVLDQLEALVDRGDLVRTVTAADVVLERPEQQGKRGVE